MLRNLHVLTLLSAHEHLIEFCSCESFETYINRQVSNVVIQWFTLPQLAFRTDMTKTFLTLTHITVCVNWESTITGNQCGDLMSTQRCCPGLMSFVIQQSANVRAVSHISKDHGAFIHKTRAVRCTLSLSRISEDHSAFIHNTRAVQQEQPTGPFRTT